jgi:hypothetical protein
MQTIKLSTKNFWFKYWNFLSYFQGVYFAPQDTCAFKRALIFKTLFHILTFPIFIISLLITLISSDLKEFYESESSYFLTALIQFTGSAVSIGVIKTSVLTGFFLGPLVFLGMAGLVIASIALLATGISKTMDIVSAKRNKNKKPSFFSELYKSWKEKLCSKIEYIN